MALVHPLSFGSSHPEHGQNLLQSRHAKEQRVPTSTRPHTAPNLPSGFPMFLNSKLAWSISENPDVLEFTYHLTHADRAEVDHALKSFKGLDRYSILSRI